MSILKFPAFCHRDLKDNEYASIVYTDNHLGAIGKVKVDLNIHRDNILEVGKYKLNPDLVGYYRVIYKKEK